ncbi:MAG: response regulator transcription factor [Steroidobacteraceae bacterium]
MTDRIPILLVDDHPIVREGLNVLLAEQPDFEVIGEVSDPAQVLPAVDALKPVLVVLDLTLAGTEITPVLRELRERHPDLRILILSMHDELVYAERLLAMGANGYLMKQEPPSELLRALRRVVAGEVYVSAPVAERILARTRQVRPVGHAGSGALDALTERERDVLRLVGEGRSTHEISLALDVSPKTVDSHRRNIREKLGLTNPRELVRYAVRWASETGAGPPVDS